MEAMRSPVIDWGVSTLSLAGEERSGDAYAVKTWENQALVAAIDGLGHGKYAAEAAGIAAETLSSHAADSKDVVSLVRRCHESLLRTRGAVLSLALFDAAENTMTWLGVGNVDSLLIRLDSRTKPVRESLFPRGGVVGYQLPSLHPSTTHVGRGDILIFSTDGIRSGFEPEVNPEETPQQIADMILANYNRKTDDALVLAVRYRGGPA
jgi:phosphoserine phosphatase RsbX